jgi:hypothetical protein
MQIEEDREQVEQRDARRPLRRSSRRRSNALVRLHARLSSGLGDFVSHRDLRVVAHRSYPFIVLKNQPFFDDALEMTSAGRRAIRTIGGELAGLPSIHSLITVHVDPCHDGVAPDWSRCYEAWQQARRIEGVLIESGADPARVLSVGIARCAEAAGKENLEERSPDSPYAITIRFSIKSDQVRDPHLETRTSGLVLRAGRSEVVSDLRPPRRPAGA